MIRNQNDQKWHTVQSAAFQNEAELQKLLANEPSLISISEVRECADTLVLAIREFPVAIGSIDILGFTKNGDIAIIECKLANNPEVKRKVIGQVLEYGASLWNMSYEELDSIIKNLQKKPLAELISEQINDPTWDEELFRQNITQNLANGNFVLMIVVDLINDDLSNIIKFINSAGTPAFSLAALEMQKYQHEGTEMLVPHVFGTVTRNREQKKNRTYDEKSFLEEARQNNSYELNEVVKDFYFWSKNIAYSLKFGTTTIGTFTAYFKRNGNISSIYTMYSDGTFYFNFSYMEKTFTAAEIEDFKDQMEKIPQISAIVKSKRNQTSFNIPLSKLVNETETRLNIKKVIEAFSK
jgi:hypothetical protein